MFFTLFRKFNALMYFWPKMVHNSLHYDTAKTPCLGKICFFNSLKPERLAFSCRFVWVCVTFLLPPGIIKELISLQYSLIINIFGTNQVSSYIYCVGIIIKEKGSISLRLPNLVLVSERNGIKSIDCSNVCRKLLRFWCGNLL